MKAILIDAFDSFSHIIYQYVSQLGVNTEVVRSGVLTAREIADRHPDFAILGPGPGHPTDSGHVELIHGLAGKLPILGVCLGQQAMGLAFGGRIGHAAQLMHGKTSPVDHDGQGMLAGLPSPLTVTRYHSLAVLDEGLPAELRVTARAADDGTVMALRHRDLPIEGVQFHPESIGTDHGLALFRGFIQQITDRESSD
ncbi:MAG: anthranilate synthase component II [Actinomycetota bacterium]